MLLNPQNSELERALRSMDLPAPAAGTKIDLDAPKFQFPPSLLHKAALLRDGSRSTAMIKEVCFKVEYKKIISEDIIFVLYV